MDWKIIHVGTGHILDRLFESRTDADAYIDRMGASFRSHYASFPVTEDDWTYRVLTEGLVRGDLRKIILPQISIDEYVPGDPSTDNVVMAFFVKGVPEAVIPFRDFIMKCAGVLDVAYGDSDTIPNTSIVYAELSRSKFKIEYLRLIMEQVALLSDLEVEDFTLRFPTSSNRYPYSEETVIKYFESRSRKQNWQAQQQAIGDGEGGEGEGGDGEAPQEQTEALIEQMIRMFRRG